MTEIYLNDHRYNQLVAALAAMPIDAASSEADVRDAVTMALGSAGVWPRTILADVIASRRAEARREQTQVARDEFGETWPD